MGFPERYIEYQYEYLGVMVLLLIWFNLDSINLRLDNSKIRNLAAIPSYSRHIYLLSFILGYLITQRAKYFFFVATYQTSCGQTRTVSCDEKSLTNGLPRQLAINLLLCFYNFLCIQEKANNTSLMRNNTVIQWQSSIVILIIWPLDLTDVNIDKVLGWAASGSGRVSN